MYNPKTKSVNCDECQTLLRIPASVSRTKEEELCDVCIKKQHSASKFLEDHKELMDNITNGTKKSRRV